MEIAGILEVIIKVLEKFGSACSEEDKKKIKDILLQYFDSGKPPMETMKVPKEESELKYSFAASLYEGGKYQEALPGFWHLFLLNPTDPRFSFGAAACQHKLKRYQEAIENYFVAARLDPKNPVYWGHAADCYIQLGNLKMACVMLTKTIECAGDDPKQSTLKKQATLIHETLKKQLDEADAKESKKTEKISIKEPQKSGSSAAQ